MINSLNLKPAAQTSTLETITESIHYSQSKEISIFECESHLIGLKAMQNVYD